jgi:hypothetical protein
MNLEVLNIKSARSNSKQSKPHAQAVPAPQTNVVSMADKGKISVTKRKRNKGDAVEAKVPVSDSTFYIIYPLLQLCILG